MIRIYLDWNVISSLKKEEFSDLLEFIRENKKKLLFIYSPAHFEDLMKSHDNNNMKFESDLNMLEKICSKNLIRWGGKNIELLFATPTNYYQSTKDEADIYDSLDIIKLFNEMDYEIEELENFNIGETYKNILKNTPSGFDVNESNIKMLKKMFPSINKDSSMWDVLKDMGPFMKNFFSNRDFYKDFRKTIGEEGLKIESNSGNWDYDEVINNIDNFLQAHIPNMTFTEYVETTHSHKKEPLTLYDLYSSSFLMLDLIGYKQDKLPKPSDSFRNIQADGDHSFYGGFCDYFVTMDKKLFTKSKVLYHYFNINTKVFHPTKLISELTQRIDKNQGLSFLETAVAFCKEENCVEYVNNIENEGLEAYGFELPIFYFNFFTHLLKTNYIKENGIVLTFKKVSKNFSNGIFYNESEQVLRSIIDFFGYPDEDLEVRLNSFLYDENCKPFVWIYELGQIRIDRNEDNRRPELSYLVSLKLFQELINEKSE